MIAVNIPVAPNLAGASPIAQPFIIPASASFTLDIPSGPF